MTTKLNKLARKLEANCYLNNPNSDTRSTNLFYYSRISLVEFALDYGVEIEMIPCSTTSSSGNKKLKYFTNKISESDNSFKGRDCTPLVLKLIQS